MDYEEMPKQLFISDPIYKREGLSGFTSYTLQGEKLPEPISKRFRDFEALRKKLVENWPGVFIPNLTQIKTESKKDRDIVGMRWYIMNRFLKQLSKIDYLMNSDEMELFCQKASNVAKNFDAIKEESYEELFKKYESVFDYHDDFDTLAGKIEQNEILNKLNQNHLILKNFSDFVFEEKQKFKEIENNYLHKLNIDLCKNISKLKKKIINPYEKLYEAIIEDYLDTQAMIEALESLKKLQGSYNKLTEKLTSTSTQINDLQGGEKK